MKMRIAFVTLSLLWVCIVAVRCTVSHKPQLSTTPASEKVIIMAMGQGLLGSSIDFLSKDERRHALEAEYKALEYAKAGEAVSWGAGSAHREGTQAGTGDKRASGSVVAGQPYQVGSQNCRQYSHSFIIGGVPRTARGSACRNPDGSWVPLT